MQLQVDLFSTRNELEAIHATLSVMPWSRETVPAFTFLAHAAQTAVVAAAGMSRSQGVVLLLQEPL